MARWRRWTDAASEFIDTIESIVHIVTPVPVAAPNSHAPPSALPRGLFLGTGQPVPLRGPGRTSLRVRLRYRLNQDAEGWWARIAAYQYALLDQREQESVAYHWHPEGLSHVVTPHLHLGAGAQVGRAELAGAHLQTGPISPTAVIRLAIEAFGVQPRRRQWATTLQAVDSWLQES